MSILSAIGRVSTCAFVASTLAFAENAPAQALDTLKVSYQPALFWALPYYIADQKGWWAELDLKPEYSTFASGAPQMAAAASGSWDIGGTGSAPAVLGAARFDIVTIGITNNESAANALVVRTSDLDAIKKDPTTLKGQQILMTTNSTGEYAASACIRGYGLAYPADVNVVNLNQQEIISAFATGTGKLAAAWAPNIYTLEEKAGSTVLCSGQDAGAIIPGALIARRDYAEKSPDMVAKYLAVYLRGVSFIRNNKDEAVKLMKDFYALTGVELPEKYLAREIETRPMYTLTEQLEIMNAQSGESEVQKWFGGLGQFLLQTGTLKEPIDPSAYVDPQYMQRVADDPKLVEFANKAN